MQIFTNTWEFILTWACIVQLSLYRSPKNVYFSSACIAHPRMYIFLQPVSLTWECIFFFSLYHSPENVLLTWSYIIHLILYCTTCYQYIIKSTKSSSCTSFTDNNYMCFVQKSHYYVVPAWKDCINWFYM